MRNKMLKLLKESYLTSVALDFHGDLDELATDMVNAIISIMRAHYICEACGVTHILPKMYKLDDMNTCIGCYNTAIKKGQ